MPADHRGQNGRQPVYQHQKGEKAGQFRPLVKVTGHRPGGDEAESAGEALEKAKGEKGNDVVAHDAADSSEREEKHADAERPLSPPMVADGAREERADSHADHGHGQRELDGGSSHAEGRRHHRQRRKIHVGGERGEGGQHS